jgi:hypothetical protein
MISGCHGTGHPGTASSLASNPVVKADVAREQAQIQRCLAKGTILTKSGRKAFLICADGGESSAKFEACATAQLRPASLLSKAGRDAWVTAIAQKCVAAS